MKKIILLIFILNLFSINIFSKEKAPFKEIDLRNEFGEVRNQGKIGWCFGYAASDLLTYYLHDTKGKYLEPKNKKSFNEINSNNIVSAIEVSYDYYKKLNFKIQNLLIKTSNIFRKKENKKNIGLREGGYPLETLKRAMKNGFYFDSEINSQTYFKGNYSALILFYKGKASLQDALKEAEKMFPLLSKKEIKKILIKSNPSNIITKLIKETRRKQRPYKITKRNDHKLGKIPRAQQMDINFIYKNNSLEIINNEKLFKKIDELLEQKKPVLISYDANILTEETLTEDRGYHASLIVGKKLENGKKVYIIRNSWGDTIFSYIENATKIYNCYSNYKKTQEEKDKKIEETLREYEEMNKENKDSWFYEPFDLEEVEKKLKKEIKVIESEKERRKKIKDCFKEIEIKPICNDITCTVPEDSQKVYIKITKERLEKALYSIVYLIY